MCIRDRSSYCKIINRSKYYKKLEALFYFFQVKIGKMHEKIKFLKKHYEEEKTRRRFDAEGFQSELNLVKIEVERLKREMAVQSKKLQKKDKENTLPGQSSNKKKS